MELGVLKLMLYNTCNHVPHQYNICIAVNINTNVSSACAELHPASGIDWIPDSELPLLPLMLDRANTDRVTCDGCSGVDIIRAFVLKLSK